MISNPASAEAVFTSIRARILLVLAAGWPRPVSESLLSRVIADLEFAVTAALLDRELGYLLVGGLVVRTEVRGQVCWLLKQQPAQAEGPVQSTTNSSHDMVVDVVIGVGLASGKITRATESHHRASCKDVFGIDRFIRFICEAPQLDGANPLSPAPVLDAVERAVCQQYGVSESDFAAARDRGVR